MIHLLWISLAVPVLIHLVHRRRAVRMPFSTLRFLRMVDQRVARRHRLKELLLLAARILLLGAVVGALYQPVVGSGAGAGGHVPTAVCIVLDNTASMRAVSGGTMGFERARKAASAVLEGLERGDGACIVPFDAARSAELSTDLETVRSRLETFECGYGAAPAADALNRAFKALGQATQPAREVYVLSDFQRSAWESLPDRFGETAAAEAPLYLVDVGREVTENLALRDVRFGPGLQVTGSPTEVFCTVENTGARDMAHAADMLVDGSGVAQADVRLAAGGVRRIKLRHAFRRPGWVAGEVRLEPDQFAPDNSRYFAVAVREKLPVLLVNGDPSGVAYEDETFYLDLALRAPARSGEATSPVSTTTVEPGRLERLRLDDYACVVLANVRRLSEGLTERLSRYVRNGGGLIVFLGDRVEIESYNRGIARDLMGVEFGGIARSEDGLPIRRINAGHPVYHGLAERMDFRRTAVRAFYRASPGEGVVALAELSDGPLLLEREVGAGLCIACTSTADMGWNNLPATPSFLPLIHQLIYRAAGSARAEEQITVGMPCKIDVPPSEEPVEVRFYGVEAEEEPLARKTVEPADRPTTVTFEGTGKPGIYRAVWRAAGAQRERLFAVNIPREESRLERMPPAQLKDALKAEKVRVLAGADFSRDVLRREREGFPLWNYLFAAGLVLLVVESWVANVWLKH